MKDVCLLGDCRDSMREMIAQGVCVQTCVTSPPYWGLRDYGVEGQLGLESTPEEYATNMVEVFRLVRELLADDGTLWLNLGDSYANQKIGDTYSGFNDRYFGRESDGGKQAQTVANFNTKLQFPGLKPKDLVGIPWRVAFALQADGWFLRSDIIWSKCNPMPESVTDRPTKAHEYLFLLSKRERYFYDADAIREPSVEPWRSGTLEGSRDRPAESLETGRPRSFGWDKREYNPAGRNRRTVWTVATEPYAEAHFATFPTALIEPCILAGSRVGDTVFDPFMGSGTVGQVAQNLGRHWLGCELNPEYVKLQAARTAQLGLVLA